MTSQRHGLPAVAGAALLIMSLLVTAGSARADEVEESINAALEAYRAGDVATAKSELDYAAQVLTQMRSESLTDVLPEPFDGWSQGEVENASLGAAMFGGGLTASADYRKDDARVEIQVMADSPMLAMMLSMFANPAMVGATGKLRKLDGHKVIETHDGELQALIANRFMVQIDGTASIEDKEAYFRAIDFERLESF